MRPSTLTLLPFRGFAARVNAYVAPKSVLKPFTVCSNTSKCALYQQTQRFHSGKFTCLSSLQKGVPLAAALKPLSFRYSFLKPAAATASVGAGASLSFASSVLTTSRYYHGGIGAQTRSMLDANKNNQLEGVKNIQEYRGEDEEENRDQGGGGEEEEPFGGNSGPGYLPFPPPFHTINIVMLLLIANLLCYFVMKFCSDDVRDFVVEHFTLSHENWTRIYPLFTNALYQENLLQLLIDCWLLWQFGDTMLNFLGNTRMTFFAVLCTLGGSFIHLGRQYFELHYGMDELEVRGRCYGPNPFIMGLISIEGLIFRHLNFIQQPPVPFLVLTAFIVVIDVWRIFTTKPEEHGASTGGAIVAFIFWALPIRFLGLDKLTATL